MVSTTSLCLGCNILQWRHNERDGVSNHRPRDCLLSPLFRHKSKKTSKLCVTGLCEGNLPVTGEYPAQGRVTRKMIPFDDVIMIYMSVCLLRRIKYVEFIQEVWVNNRGQYSDVTMSAMASQITGVSIVYSTVCSGADKKTPKPRLTDLCDGNPQVTDGFPSQRAIWWRHQECSSVVFTKAFIWP